MRASSPVTAAIALMGALVVTWPGLAAAPSFLKTWDGFTGQLHDLAPRMIARLPQRIREDPQVQQEVGRLILEALAARTLEAISADADHPVFLPVLNVTLNVFQPNADTTYRLARIAAGASYRMLGDIGSLKIAVLGQSGPMPDETASGFVPLAYNDFRELHADRDGHFDVLLSQSKPARYTGDWWHLDPSATVLQVRQVASDWQNERDPRISIERTDRPVERPRPSVAELNARLARLGTVVSNTALFFVDHAERLRQQGFLNKLKVFDLSKLGGLAGQFYYEGAYELTPDTALIVEAKVPDKCRYWSMILTNDIYETTDWYNNQSSLNGSQARVDGDGVVRFVVSARDPGVPNWLDVAGYMNGVMQGRWMQCNAQPIPTVRKVALADVRRLLPGDTPVVTPMQREQSIRERRRAAQMRSLW